MLQHRMNTKQLHLWILPLTDLPTRLEEQMDLVSNRWMEPWIAESLLNTSVGSTQNRYVGENEVKDSEAAADISSIKSGASSGNICKCRLRYLQTVETLSAFRFDDSARLQSSCRVNPKFSGCCSLSVAEKSVKNCWRNEKDMNNRVIE